MNILAVNPWIYDFAAYDFWLKPYGFLVLLEYLTNKSVHIDFIDCLDTKKATDQYQRGKYPSCIIQKPEILASIPRYFKRYGIDLADFENRIKKKRPDYILVTSSMTYWYPGVKKVVEILKLYFPKTPIILGGTNLQPR